MFSKILVATDGYGPASKAVERAVELAERSGAEVVVVHALSAEQEAPEPLGPRHQTKTIDAGRGLLDDVVKRHGGRAPMRTVLRQGGAADVILETAEEEQADLIVLGNKGMSKRFHSGSVPNRVSHHAPCSLLIVHTVDE